MSDTHHENLFRCIRNLQHTLMQIASGTHPGGLRHSEFFMLFLVARHCVDKNYNSCEENASEEKDCAIQGVQISRLCEVLGCSRPNASQLINVLEDKGYIERIRSSKDRRAVYLVPTAEGKALIETAAWPMLEAIAQAAEAMGEEKITQFIALCNELTEYINMKKSTKERTSEACEN